MAATDANELIEPLRTMSASIQQKLLQLTDALLSHGDWVYDDVADRFEYLFSEFDRFSRQAKDCPECPELHHVKSELNDAYSRLRELRDAARDHIRTAPGIVVPDVPAPEPDDEETAEDDPEEIYPEEPPCDDSSGNDQTPGEEEYPPGRRKRQVRIVRKPAGLSAEDVRAETERRRKQQILLEEIQSQEDAARDRIRQEDELLASYREHQHQSEQFERLGSHNDLSKAFAADPAAAPEPEEDGDDRSQIADHPFSSQPISAATPTSGSNRGLPDSAAAILQSRMPEEPAFCFQSSAPRSQTVPYSQGPASKYDPLPWSNRQIHGETDGLRKAPLHIPGVNPELIPEPTHWSRDQLRTEAQHWLGGQKHFREMPVPREPALPIAGYGKTGLNDRSVWKVPSSERLYTASPAHRPSDSAHLFDRTAAVQTSGHQMPASDFVAREPGRNPERPRILHGPGTASAVYSPNIAHWSDRKLYREASKWRKQQLHDHPDVNPELIPNPVTWSPEKLRHAASRWLDRQYGSDFPTSGGMEIPHPSAAEPGWVSTGTPVKAPIHSAVSKLPDPSKWSEDKLRTEAAKWWQQKKTVYSESADSIPSRPSSVDKTSPGFRSQILPGTTSKQIFPEQKVPLSDITLLSDRRLRQKAAVWYQDQIRLHPDRHPDQIPDPSRWPAEKLRTHAQQWVLRQKAPGQFHPEQVAGNTTDPLSVSETDHGAPEDFSEALPVRKPVPNPAVWSDQKLRSEALKWWNQQHRDFQENNEPVCTTQKDPARKSQLPAFGQPELGGHPPSAKEVPTDGLFSDRTEQRLFLRAVEMCLAKQTVSAVLIQERLKIPADQAEKLIRHMAHLGLLDEKPEHRRENKLLVTNAQWNSVQDAILSGRPVAVRNRAAIQDQNPAQWPIEKLRSEAVKWWTLQQKPDTKSGVRFSEDVEDPSCWPIEKLRAAAEKWWLDQNIRDQEPGSTMPGSFGISRQTQAQDAAERAAIPRHRYQLRGIGQRIGGITYMVYFRTVQEIINKSENDTLRALSSGSYYLSTASAAAGVIFAPRPTANLQTSCSRITGEQLKVGMKQAFLKEKQLVQQIDALQKAYAQTRSVPEREALSQKIRRLQKQLDALSGDLRTAKAAYRLLHEQELDRVLLQYLTVNGRLVKRAPNLVDLGHRFLWEQQAALRKQYGVLNGLSDRELKAEIRKLKATGAEIRQRLHFLLGRKHLSEAEQAEILALRQRLTQLGQQIGKRAGLLRKREDLAYQESRLGKIFQTAGGKSQRIRSLSMFMRSMATRPLYNEQTEGTARMIQIASNKQLRRTAATVAKAPVLVTGKATEKIAPQLSNRIHIAVDGKKEILHQTQKRLIHNIKSGITSAVPSGIRTAAAQAHTKYTVIQKSVTGIRTWYANTAAGQWLAVKRFQSKELIQKTATLARGLMLKLVAAVMVLILLVGILTAVLNTLVTTALGGGVILSPEDPTISGKINLSPYTAILRDETNKFNDQVDRIAQALEDLLQSNGKYQGEFLGRFTTEHSGPYSNDREILSMMAVRFNQDLDLQKNPGIEVYLRYLHTQSHSVRDKVVGSKHYHTQSEVHAGICPTPQIRIKQTRSAAVSEVPDALTPDQASSFSVVIPGRPEPIQPTEPGTTDPTEPPDPTEPEYEKYCPGHINVKIHVNVIGFDSLFALDDGGYESDPDWVEANPEWEGWTEDNIERVKLMYSMPWGELYEGFSPSNSTVIGSIATAADEQAIWNALMVLTGNNAFGAAGLMGNLYAESSLSSRNLQDSYEPILGYTDQTYTDAVDSGSYGNFADDSAGYGLAQWTYSVRKQNLLDYAHSRGSSIGDLQMQLDFLATELKDTSVLSVLKGADSVRMASDEVLVNFEKPADQSQAVKDTRTSYGEYFYNKFVYGTEAEGSLTQKQRDVIHIATNSQAYGIPAEKGMCQAWAASIYEAAGLPVDHSPSAVASGQRYGVSEDFSIVPPGAAVYGYSGNQYGHVGIYVGNGLVYHNIGGVAVDTLEDWVRIYDGFCWGWQAGTDLTLLD